MGDHADTASARSRRQREATLLYRAAGWAVLRAVISVAVVVTIYYLLPWDRSSAGAAVTWLVIGLMMLIGLIAFQVRAIVRSPFPGPRAIEALATSLSLVLLLFAATYVVLSTLSAKNFGVQLSHTDGLYFTVTVFATVGFGDITAHTQLARLVVTGQMLADLVVLGLAVRVFLGAVQRGRQQRSTAGDQAPGASQPST